MKYFYSIRLKDKTGHEYRSSGVLESDNDPEEIYDFIIQNAKDEIYEQYFERCNDVFVYSFNRI